METDERAREEGIHIKYVGHDAYWIDGAVLFVASAIAITAACLFVTAGVSPAVVGRAMVWLSLPWFIALYFLSRKLRKIAGSGFEIVLSFGAVPVPVYAASFIVILLTFSQFLRK
jgi:hypothetical protein